MDGVEQRPLLNMTDLPLLRVCVSLLAVVGLLLAALWPLRRLGGLGLSGGGKPWNKQQGRRIALLHTQPLGAPRTQLALVRIDTEELLLGITPNQITLLHALPRTAPAVAKDSASTQVRTGAAEAADLAEPPAPAHSPLRFASVFEQLRARLRTPL